MNPDVDLRTLVSQATAALEQAGSGDGPFTQEFTAETADGAVTATVVGGQLTDVSIGPSARREFDNITLGELVVEAINQAEERAERARNEFLAGLSIGSVNVADFLSDPTGLLRRLGIPSPREEGRA